MRIVIAAAIVCSTSLAAAGGITFDRFRLINERPALHKTAELQRPIKPLRARVVACGMPALDTRLGMSTANVKLHVAADGTISNVELPAKLLGEEVAECIAKLLQAVTYPAKKKPSVVWFALVYKRST